jgi:hypothetical protein
MFNCHGCKKETRETTFGAYMGYISRKPVCRECFDKEKAQQEKLMNEKFGLEPTCTCEHQDDCCDECFEKRIWGLQDQIRQAQEDIKLHDRDQHWQGLVNLARFLPAVLVLEQERERRQSNGYKSLATIHREIYGPPPEEGEFNEQALL